MSDQAYDYWASESDEGTSATWAFAGAEGLHRLTGPFEYRAAEPPSFRAQLTRVQVDHIALETFQASPHTTCRTAARVERFPTPLLTFLLVAEGVLQVDLETASFDLEVGQFAVVDSRDPFAYRADRDVRLLKSVVGIEHIPGRLRRRSATVAGPLRRTPLVDSFIAFTSSILRTTAGGRRAEGGHLIRAVSDLQSAVLAESQEASPAPAGVAGLAYRMEEYIEAHLGEPDLDVSKVAAAMDVSVRQTHAVFDRGDRTMARFIRDRRVSAVAQELRTRDEPVQFAYLAQRHGFGSADSLARAFRQRYGMTLTDYRSGGHRAFG